MGWIAFLLLLTNDPPIAVRGATVVVTPERTLENATVVVRNGLIESVGVDVTPPADAEVIDGKGLIVYAGFIDARTPFGIADAGLDRSAREGRKPDFTRDPLLGMQDANRKGLSPERRAAEILAPSDGEVKKWQAAGFCALVAAPDDGYLSGTSVVLCLSGGPRRESILRASWAMHASFRARGDGYPTTLMGSLAQLRQFLLDAQDYRRRWADYRETSLGKPRPAYDPALEAIQPALDGKHPVVFEANTENEIRRALDFAEDWKLTVVLAGAAEADKAVDRLAKVPVLLSLKWPEESKKRDDHPKKLIDEEKRLREERICCALKLQEAGVKFALTSHGISPSDLLGNVQKLVEKGLAREAALRALTQAPAQILGIAEIGSVEPGRIANLTVLTAPIGDKKAKVRYVFADGHKVEFDVRKAGGAPPEIDLTGKWNLTVDEPKMDVTMELKQKEAELSGKIVSDHGEIEVSGSVSGKKFKLTGQFHGAEFSMDGEWKEGKLAGKIKTLTGEGGFAATKPEGHHD